MTLYRGEDRARDPHRPMWIRNDNPHTERLFNADLMNEPVEFTDNGTANVPADVARRLIDHYETIHEKH